MKSKQIFLIICVFFFLLISGYSLLHVFMGRLHGLGSEAHVLEHFSVGIGIFQSFSLELDCRQRAVDLGELLLIPLLSFQSLQSRCGWRERESQRVCHWKNYDTFPPANGKLAGDSVHPITSLSNTFLEINTSNKNTDQVWLHVKFGLDIWEDNPDCWGFAIQTVSSFIYDKMFSNLLIRFPRKTILV